MPDLRNIDLNLLVVFHEVYRERQISLAARRLHLTQSAVSNALGRLRRTFDDALFVRTAQGMQPTPFAERLAEPVAGALAAIGEAVNAPQAFDATSSVRHFRLAMTDVGEVYFMPVLIDLLRQRAPKVQVSTVRVAGATDLKREMEVGRVDLAVGAFDDASPALYQRRLFEQQYVTMFRKGHALAAGKLTLRRLLAAEHLIVSASGSPYDRVNALLEKAGVPVAAACQVPHFMAVPYIVGSTDLVVTVPEKLAQRAAAPFDLVFARPPLPLPALQTRLFWHRRYSDDAGNRWLRELMAETFGD
ncbi:LysR family transcriptional regulator [Duganella sp. Leaf126]|uniref:LysR family transcriptional regulator n=1 Tax=Duganella sp. Leaf126 TaxID=1736266 RepID=UPI000A7B1A99|nr:LysR family transcriptional regulator [Duganella sp. Leaf126]